MEDCGASHLIFNVQDLSFDWKTDWDVAEIELFLDKGTLRLIDNTLTFNINTFSIRDLKHKEFLLALLSRWFECNIDILGGSCGYFIFLGVWDKGHA